MRRVKRGNNQMMRTELNIESLEQTRELAKALGRAALKFEAGSKEGGMGGGIIALDGPLGAGKTTLVRYLAEALGIDVRQVSSPTFVIINEYANGQGPDLVHVDAYRLGSGDELDELGWDLIVSGQAATESLIVVIEWASRVADALPGDGRVLWVALEPRGETQRRVTIRGSQRWDEACNFSSLSGQTREGWSRCPITDELVSPDCPTFPFANERAKMADLHRWFSGDYRIASDRPIEDEAGG